jgi:lipid A 4'-phosphatase
MRLPGGYEASFGQGPSNLMGIMRAADPQAEFKSQDGINVSWLLWATVVTGVVAAALFFAFPAIDIETSALFYKGNGAFAGTDGGSFYRVPTTVGDALRMTLYICSVIVCLGTLIGLVASGLGKRDVLGLSIVKWLFLGVCLAAGPGLVTNAILKDHWGRARPVQIVEFGGTKSYSPPLVISHQCARNCSFVAGEPSTVYATFFAAAFLFPNLGRRLFAAGIVGGLLAGLMRISQGAHFLSDVIFSGVAMSLTVAVVYLIFEAAGRADRKKTHPETNNTPA